MYIHKCAQDIKEQIDKKNKLISRRKEVMESVKKGYHFFITKEDTGDKNALSKGTKRMIELVSELEDIDKQLIDLDIIIVTKIEAEFGDFVARGYIPEKLNEAGDMIPNTNIMLSPFKTDDPCMIEVTPDDLWFIKLAKQALNVSGIEFLRKPQAKED